ncbi:Pregnancy-associated plasma protein-A [Microdochium nivale]|nr:Pregnancy-associated plasma protein-A [Microdochium nivale]
MIITRLLAAVLALYSSTALAAAAPKKPKSGIVLGCKSDPPQQFVSEAKAVATAEAEQVDTMATLSGPSNLSIITVDTYFHVVAAGKDISDGWVPATAPKLQLAAMNAAYAPWGIVFRLKGVDWTVNQAWADDLDTDAMKASLRKGNYAALNIYFQRTIMGGTASGFCYFPMAGPPAKGSQWYNADGCQVQSLTMPGAAPPGWWPMQGLIAVHEVGHWFGLFHTFQGYSCEGTGDTIADTPTTLGPSTDCSRKNTCPTRKGVDMVNNYMDYSGEGCWSAFTTGQGKRMRSNWKVYRKVANK